MGLFPTNDSDDSEPDTTFNPKPYSDPPYSHPEVFFVTFDCAFQSVFLPGHGCGSESQKRDAEM